VANKCGQLDRWCRHHQQRPGERGSSDHPLGCDIGTQLGVRDLTLRPPTNDWEKGKNLCGSRAGRSPKRFVAPRMVRLVVKNGKQFRVGEACNCRFADVHRGKNKAGAESDGGSASDAFNAIKADCVGRLSELWRNGNARQPSQLALCPRSHDTEPQRPGQG
jgi:hypothetical protein